MALKYAAKAESLHEVVEAVSTRVGLVMLILAAMHFLNLLAFARWRRRATLHAGPPPILPTAYLHSSKA